MKISVRMEGGLGDHLLANRFIPAIKEQWPGCKIDLWSDTEGNKFQSDVLKKMWPSYFNDIFVLEEKRYKRLKIISSNFPEEDYRGSIKNVKPTAYISALKFNLPALTCRRTHSRVVFGTRSMERVQSQSRSTDPMVVCLKQRVQG